MLAALCGSVRRAGAALGPGRTILVRGKAVPSLICLSTSSSISVRVVGSVISLKDVQPLKVPPRISVRVVGSAILLKDLQLWKADSPIVVMECGSVMLTKDMQP